jgi:septal ring factor EnvC (AmiA/AmiB activator)
VLAKSKIRAPQSPAGAFPTAVVYSRHMAKKTNLSELGSMLTHVVKHMATKADIADLRRETMADFAAVKKEMATKRDIVAIMEELADIKQRLRDVEAAVETHAGHSKKIDHALDRIAAIEKHLGLDKRIAA